MNLYDDEDYYLEEQGYRRSPLTIFKVIGLLIAFVFLPTIATASLIFLIFMRTLRWKPSVTIIPLSVLFLMLLVFSSGPLSNLGLPNANTDFNQVLMSYLYLSILIGIPLGYGIIIYKALDLKRYPEYVYLKGWAYEFKYKPTPLDRIRKKKNIESLKNGNEFNYKKAPIGVLDAPVKNADLEGTLDMKNANRAAIVHRHYTEAMAHTLITGKTGSGKALHKDTEIRSKEKGWVTVGDIEVGDTIYDESGNHTKVIDVYQPMTPDHYELTFDNGEVVRACGDHLWNIGDVRDNNTVETRELLFNYSYNERYSITHSIDGKKITHNLLKIKRVTDNAEDYFCFTVDSESRLFLITRSFIPTHNTVTMLSLIENDILAGNPICVIDFKKSPDIIYFLSKWAKENDREFFHFVSGKPGTYKNPYKDDQATYDPLSTGGATAKADMILNLRTWDASSEVFKKRTQDVLQSLFFLLERTPREAAPGIDWDSGGIAQFVSALDLNNFKRMIELMAVDMQAGNLSDGDVRRYKTLVDLYKELSTPAKSDLKAQIVELLSIARTLIVSNYGDWLATGTSDYHIDLMDIATSEDAPIVLFSFNQQEEPEFAEYIGSIVMSDLSRVSALKNNMGNTTKFGVYIDEFQTLDPATVKDNLEKARSSKMYITLSLQSIDQIVSSADSAGEAMANAIIDTTANFIFHDGSGYDTAEKMSKIIGKTKRYTYRATSESNNRLIKYRLMSVDKAMVSKEVEEDWLVPPSEFQSLESPAASNNYKATAYVINKSSDDSRFKRGGGALARKVHVVVKDETAEGVPDSFKRDIFIDRDELEPNFEDIKSEMIEGLLPQGSSDDGGWQIVDSPTKDDEKDINIEKEDTANENVDNKQPVVNNKNNDITDNNTTKLPSLGASKGDSGSVKTNREKSEKPSQLDVFKQLSNKGKGKDKERSKNKQSKDPNKVESKAKSEDVSLPKLPKLD